MTDAGSDRGGRARIGIDLGGTKIEGIVLDPGGRVLGGERVPTPPSHDYDEILAAIQTLVERLRGVATGRASIGIGTPGAPSRSNGLMKNCNTTSLNGRPLASDLAARLGPDIRLANDANCFALSEAVDGSGRDHRVVFGVILGTGVGGGLVFERSIHEGPNSIAGEWGHTSIDPDGPACYCGDRGCIETFLSGPGFETDYRHHGGEPGVGAEAIVRRAASGDRKAEEAVARYLDRFGRALAIVVDVVDPDAIVLGGGLSRFDRLYDEGRRALGRHVFGGELETPILRPTHGDASGVRGAAMLWPAPVL